MTSFSRAPPMILNLWDSNDTDRIASFGRDDVYLGSAIIPLAEASTDLKPEIFKKDELVMV